MLIHELTRDECRAVLDRSHLARLACSRHDQPYIVPIYIEFDGGEDIYSFSTVGQKVDWMRANPRVCVEVDDVTDTAHWISVVAIGRYEELTDAPGDRDARHRARQLLERRHEFWLPAAAKLPASASEHPTTVLYRIRIDRLSGRRTARQP